VDRPDQLNLPDDPAFLPDFDMNLDLSTFEVSTSTSGFSSSMTPLSFPSGRSSLAIEPIQEAALVFPSAETPLAVDFSGFAFAGDTGSVLKTANRADRVSMFEDTGMIEDPGFEYDFDAKGNLVEYATRRERQRVSHSIADPASKTWIASAISGQIREEQETSLQGAQVRRGSSFDEANIFLPEQLDQDMAFNDAPPFVCGDEDPPLREVSPFSPARRLTPTPAQQIPHSSSVRAEEEMTSSVEAPQLKAQAPKVIRPDSRQELANADLAQWNTNYLTNMAEATKVKQQHKTGVLAKKNATFWVLGQGIAGVGIRLADHRVPNPLEMFCGQTLLTTLTGREVSPTGTKRTRTFSVDLDERGEARRVRARGEREQQVWRGDTDRNDRESLLLGEDGVMFPGDDMVCRVPFLVLTC
jgi:meiotic recombination protein REC8